MTWLSDDPTWAAGTLVLASIGCFLALRTTQQGRFLVWGLAAAAGAVLVVVVERVWVTDEERIESVVYDLRAALLAGDADEVLARMTPDVQYVQEGQTLSGSATRALIRSSLANTNLETVRVHGLRTSVGRRSRRGEAQFKVFTQGAFQGPFGLGGAGTADTAWSLGFEEDEPGVWKVNRITPISLPFNMAATINSPPPPPRPRFHRWRPDHDQDRGGDRRRNRGDREPGRLPWPSDPSPTEPAPGVDEPGFGAAAGLAPR